LIVRRFSWARTLWLIYPFRLLDINHHYHLPPCIMVRLLVLQSISSYWLTGWFQGQAKKTRKFATVKRMLNPNDIRLCAPLHLLPRPNHMLISSQKGEPTKAETEGRKGEGKSRPSSVRPPSIHFKRQELTNTHEQWTSPFLPIPLPQCSPRPSLSRIDRYEFYQFQFTK